MASLPIDRETRFFISEMLRRWHSVSSKYRYKIGKPIELTSDQTKMLAIARELRKRAREDPKAEMSEIERLAVGNFAYFLVETWHDLHGTPHEKRPPRGAYINPVI